MSIKKKLIITLGMLFVIMAGISVFSLVMLSEVNKQSTTISKNVIPKLNEAHDLNFYVARFRSTEYKHTVLSNADDMSAAEKQMDDFSALIDKELANMKSENDTGVDAIITDWEAYKKEHIEFVKLSRNMDTEGCIKILMGDMKKQYDTISAFSEAQVKIENKNALAVSKAGDLQYSQSRTILILTAIFAIVFGSVFGTLLLRAIVKPLRKFQDELTILASNGGDLTKTIDVTTKDEMGDMAKALNAFLQNLREIIIEVNHSANEVMISSDFVRTKIESLNGNISDSSASIEELSASMEETAASAEAIEQINLLSNSILEISNQTNLLALNASIEAARAGESGRGFAVVATEIGNLADNSKSTVSEIQKITLDVVAAVRDLSKETLQLMEFMDGTVINDYNSFVDVGDAYGNDAKFVDGLVTEISATSQELSATVEGIMSAIEDVTTAMNQGAAGTQDVAKQVSEIALISEEVDTQSKKSAENAKKLIEAVGKFTV